MAHKLKSQSMPGPVTADGQKTWSSHATGFMGDGRGVARGNQGISASAHLVTSLPPFQPLHLPSGLIQPTLQSIPRHCSTGWWLQTAQRLPHLLRKQLPPPWLCELTCWPRSLPRIVSPSSSCHYPQHLKPPWPNLASQQAAHSLVVLKSRQPTQNTVSPLHRLPRVNSDKTTSLPAWQRSQRSFKIHQQESSRRSGNTLSWHTQMHAGL